ncbi:nucleotide exchange factor GrpE [Uliginosibacterium sp. 31-16]|uniref:nucleotide exchange factor GrpE n=1 Tax=Uliginosibacterium sp. 31-16 TaxID=3068315 RepID=UPI00273DF773|nr:nucleotide exchange factor GrpE [Uliginosibacterium sp. 31-16]MDP5239538.1 nucleotide exchange factor GrpE [Uliginosibacterium sp. 31-16]
MSHPQDSLITDSHAPDSPQEPVEGVEATTVDTLPSLEEQLRQTELLAAEHHDAWLRAKAETENMRRRAQEDISKAAKFAIEKFANELLVVKDSLEQTLAVEGASLEAIREGADLTLKNLAKAFEKSGLAEINPVGEKFDPHKHQAISAVPSEQPANTVVQVFQKGYALEGRVLRPALVAVAQSA